MIAFHVASTGDLACNPGMCPDWELNWWPFGSQSVLNPLSYTSQVYIFIYILYIHIIHIYTFLFLSLFLSHSLSREIIVGLASLKSVGYSLTGNLGKRWSHSLEHWLKRAVQKSGNSGWMFTVLSWGRIPSYLGNLSFALKAFNDYKSLTHIMEGNLIYVKPIYYKC